MFREQEKDPVGNLLHRIICEGEVGGAVILLSSDEKVYKTGTKLGACTADFLERQME